MKTVLCVLGLAAVLLIAHIAEAGCGWYLMLPLQTDYNKNALYFEAIKILEKAPISKWEQEGGYDSSNACELMKDKHIQRAQLTYAKSFDEFRRLDDLDVKGTDAKRIAVEHDHANHARYLAARCIASDDARLR